MKAEFTIHGELKITPETMAESIALKYMFVDEPDVLNWAEKIIIDSDIEKINNNKD